MRKAVPLAVATMMALSLALVGCGGGSGRVKPDTNFEVREAITDALATDRSLDASARATIASVKAGTLDLQQGLNSFVGQSTTLLDLIGNVTSRPRPTNQYLASAQVSMEDYLRKREFQLEQAMVARSAAEAEAAYAGGQQAIDAARQQVRDLLLKYDPGLEKSLP
jgi:hypothetical protein